MNNRFKALVILPLLALSVPGAAFAGPREELSSVTPEEYRQTVELLTSLSTGTVDMRVKAAESFVRQKDEHKIRVLIGTLMQVGVNEEVFGPFTQIKDKTALAALRELSGNKNEWVKTAAACVLAVKGDAAAEKILIKALDSNGEQIGNIAAIILGRIHSRAAFEPLLAEIERHRHSPPAKADIKFLAGALKQIDELGAAQDLIANLGASKNDLNMASVEALGYIGSSESVIPLATWLQQATPVQRNRVAKALGRIGDPRAVAPLLEALKAEKGNDKLFTIDALIAICTPDSIRAAFTELDNENVLVRKRIALSLTERMCKQKEAFPFLVKGLSDTSPEVRGEMVAALCYQNADDAIPALEEAILTEKDLHVKQRMIGAVDYLRKLGK